MQALKGPTILPRPDSLSDEEADYWNETLRFGIKIGTELEVVPRYGGNSTEFVEALMTELAPSGNNDWLGRYGVLDVDKEHCGAEIRLVGRYPHFAQLRKQHIHIVKTVRRLKGRVNAACGFHFHLLAPHLGEPIPEIVAANLWNLTRRYAPELKLLTSAGANRNSICRRRNHNSHREMVRLSPAVLTMKEIAQTLNESSQVPAHQNFLNLEHMRFTDSGDIKIFHIENRFPDAHLVPLAVTSVAFLFFAMLLKSIDLSRHGVIHVGSIESWRKKQRILHLLSNNEGNCAASDTRGISDHLCRSLSAGALELLRLLSPVFKRFSRNPSFEILSSLAHRPVSLRRIAGAEWDDIEQDLETYLPKPRPATDRLDARLLQSIEMCEWSGFRSEREWCGTAAQRLYLPCFEVRKRIERLGSHRSFKWNRRLGTLSFAE